MIQRIGCVASVFASLVLASACSSDEEGRHVPPGTGGSGGGAGGTGASAGRGGTGGATGGSSGRSGGGTGGTSAGTGGTTGGTGGSSAGTGGTTGGTGGTTGGASGSGGGGTGGVDAGDSGSDATADAPSDGAAIDASDASDGGLCGPATSPAPGCADGVRRGLTNASRHPDVAVCAGAWTGDVSNGIALCATGFHVCTGAESALNAVTFDEALCFDGCYAFDAAQDNFQCFPDCSSRAGTVDTATGLDMGGMGSGCPYQFRNAGSCLTGGRIDASENDGIGCSYDARFSGVVCCRD
jgi:hypothetical protein